jgi:hypothetical protein
VRKFNEGMAKMVQWIDVDRVKISSSFVNAFIWDLIVEFYKAIEKKFGLIAIPSIGSLQHCFQ